MIEVALGTAAGIWLAVYGLALFATLTWAALNESAIAATVFMAIGAVIGYAALGISVSASLPVALLGIALYAVTGVAYAYWYALPKFLHDNAQNIADDYKRWKSISAENTKVSEFTRSAYYRYSIRGNANAAASWVILWPISAIIDLSYRPVTALYRKIGRVLEQRNAKLAASIIDEARHD